ncbi:hypothetical protein K438DRAFT_2127778 [Mycena galopus ATCC 62051]|nr:hypothetical protein K438DRAFT_2127778 [Mycena galopus ATCC 62051]
MLELGSANHSLFTRISDQIVNNTVLISDIDRIRSNVASPAFGGHDDGVVRGNALAKKKAGKRSGGKVRFGSGSGPFWPNAEPEPRVRFSNSPNLEPERAFRFGSASEEFSLLRKSHDVIVAFKVQRDSTECSAFERLASRPNVEPEPGVRVGPALNLNAERGFGSGSVQFPSGYPGTRTLRPSRRSLPVVGPASSAEAMRASMRARGGGGYGATEWNWGSVSWDEVGSGMELELNERWLSKFYLNAGVDGKAEGKANNSQLCPRLGPRVHLQLRRARDELEDERLRCADEDGCERARSVFGVRA